MSVNLVINGVSFAYPATGDQQWGSAATLWAQAVTSGMLQKAGGNFALTADVNFGPTYGLVAPYFKSIASNVSSAGTIRLSSADAGIAWRNAANSGNIALTTDGSDNLTYNGNIIFNTSGSFIGTVARSAITPAIPLTGTLVTETGTEALTNKDYQGGTASNSSRMTVPGNTTTNITALTRKAATILFNTTTKRITWDNGSYLAAMNFDIIYAKEYGVKADGSTDDSTAINNALAAGNFIVLPAGTINVNSEILMSDNQWLVGQGRGNTIVRAGANSINLIHYTGSNGGVRGFNLDSNSHTNVSGLRITPVSESQTTTKVNQNYNMFEDLYITNCTEAIVMQCGPGTVSGASGCWYNTFVGVHGFNNTRNLWLKEGAYDGSHTPSGVNRNKFFSCRFGNGGNTGIQVDAGTENSFFGCTGEGLTSGSSPNATPTFIKIANAGVHTGANNTNKFFGCEGESNTRDLENANAYSEFYSCGLATNNLFTANPLIMIGGNDASNVPFVTPGFIYQTNSQISAYPNRASVIGSTTNDSATAGCVGEYVESLVTSITSWPVAPNTYGDLTSISLTAGDWDVTCFMQWDSNGGNVLDVEAGIGLFSGTNGSGIVYGVNSDLIQNSSNLAFTFFCLKVPSYRLSLSGTTTVYLKSAANYGGSPRYRCRLSARRVR